MYADCVWERVESGQCLSRETPENVNGIEKGSGKVSHVSTPQKYSSPPPQRAVARITTTRYTGCFTIPKLRDFDYLLSQHLVNSKISAFINMLDAFHSSIDQ